MVTILGHHISIIREGRTKIPRIFKDEHPSPKYNTRSKTIKEHSGKVSAISIRLKTGEIKSIKIGTHIDVINTFNCNPEDVDATGWLLENGNYIWR